MQIVIKHVDEEERRWKGIERNRVRKRIESDDLIEVYGDTNRDNSRNIRECVWERELGKK